MNLLDSLFGGQRQRVLGWLLLHPNEALHVRELARLTGTHAGSLHRELARLAEAGLLIRSTRGNQVLYQANRSCPVFAELAGLFRKTSGVADVLRSALAPLSAQIELALVFGSVARGEETARSDVDVLVVGQVALPKWWPRFTPVRKRWAATSTRWCIRPPNGAPGRPTTTISCATSCPNRLAAVGRR